MVKLKLQGKEGHCLQTPSTITGLPQPTLRAGGMAALQELWHLGAEL